MNRADFEKLVEEGFAAIPEKFRKKARNVALIVEDEPCSEVREAEGLSEGETLLGYYRGIPATERGEHYGVGETLPDTIFIYQKTIEEACDGDPLRIREMVFETVAHEFAHYLGMDEDEVTFWEKRKRAK